MVSGARRSSSSKSSTLSGSFVRTRPLTNSLPSPPQVPCRLDAVEGNLGVASRLAVALSRRPECAVDTRSGRLGEVMGQAGGRVQLCPIGGGREWDCPPESVEPAPPDEVLRERVRRLNRDSVSGVT